MLRLVLGAATAGLTYLLLAATLIAKAKIYRQLRDRVEVLSRGLVEEVRARTMPYLERWIADKK